MDIHLPIKHNFVLSCVDTDGLTFCKPDQTPFKEEEVDTLLIELNSFMPERVKLDLEEVYPKILVIKAKNYVLQYPDGTLRHKGSALRSPTLEPALKEFLNKVIDSILQDKQDYDKIYFEYVKEAIDVKDIKRWSTRKTISEKTLESERTNESRIRDAIEGSEYVEGDRAYFFFTSNGELSLIENYKGDYNRDKMLGKLYKCSQRFNTVLNTKDLFLNFSLKRNSKKLKEI